MIKYIAKGLLVGPYIPSLESTVDGVNISRSKETTKWETPTSPISAHAGNNDDSLITFTPNRITIETSALLQWEVEAESSKKASEAANIKFGKICDSLSIGCIEARYFFQFANLQKITDDIDPERTMSDPLHVISYVTATFTPEFEQYAQAISAIDDADGADVIRSFGDSLRKYDSLGLYQVMEKITHILSKEVKAAQDTEAIEKERKEAVDTLQELLNDASKSVDEKAKFIKTTTENIRRLNLEQNGKRIAATAAHLGLRGEVAKVIDDAIKYRNTVLAHHNPGTEKQDKGIKDIQESARFFVIRYLELKFGLKLPRLLDVKYQDYWYRYTYANSNMRTEALTSFQPVKA
jgi:hypothetical protein